MRRLFSGRVLVALLFVFACGSGDSDERGSSSASASASAASSSASSTGAGGSGGGGGGGGAGGGSSVTLSLPQFVHGAARVDVEAFPQIPVVVAVKSGAPDSVEVSVEGQTVTASQGKNGLVATLTTSGLAPGPHMLTATAKSSGKDIGDIQGTLTVDSDSLKFTDFSKDGPAYQDLLYYDAVNDALAYTWVSVASGKHHLYLNRLDGAFARLTPNDVVLNDPADEPLDGATAFGSDGIGVVYRTAKANDSHWAMKLRVTDPQGKVVVPTVDLTGQDAAFSVEAAGADPNGYSAAWLNIPSGGDPMNPPPVEVRFARWDMKKNALVGPIVLDHDQPAPQGSSQGTQLLEPLAELQIACNDEICVVTYTRDVYNALVDLNIPKLFVGVVDLSSGQMTGSPQAVEDTDWDTQMFGQHLIAKSDGSFVLIYTANDTDAAVNPKSACDMTLERDDLWVVTVHADGEIQGAPKKLFDEEGPREYPRIAAHPDGYALFWEDQRSECGPNGHIRMAMNVASASLQLQDPYLEVPGSIALPPEDPTLAVTGSNFSVGWSDDRDGSGLADPKPELRLDTYWRD